MPTGGIDGQAGWLPKTTRRGWFSRKQSADAILSAVGILPSRLPTRSRKKRPLPPRWTGRGWSRAFKISAEVIAHIFAVDLSHRVRAYLFDRNVLIRGGW